MSRTTVLLMAALLVAAGVPATAAFAQESSGEQPGATFAGVVGVQGAEVEGEVAQRALDRRLAAAETNASKAAVLAGETEDARGQLADLRERRETLRARYQSGEITRGEYRSKLARIAAQIRTLERRLNTSAAVAADLPPETLRERGVNVSAIAELRRNASEMADGEVAEAAREIGGNGTGEGLTGDPGPPEVAGPPAGAGPPEDAGSQGDTGPPESSGDRGNASDGDTGNGEEDERGEAASQRTERERETAGPPGATGEAAAESGEDRGNSNRSAAGGGGGDSDGAVGNGSDPAAGNGDERGRSDGTGGSDDGERGSSGDAADEADGGDGGNDGGDRGDTGDARGNGDGDDTDGETETETESDAGRLSGSTAAPNLTWYAR